MAQTFAISDNYWMWNESNIIENLKNQIKREKMYCHCSIHHSNLCSNHNGY